MFKLASAATLLASAAAGALRGADLSYSEADGYVMASYAAAAYASSSDLYAWSCSDCAYNPNFQIQAVVDDSEYDLQAFVGYDSDLGEAIVSFRGTVSTSIQDWIDDLSFTKTSPYSGSYSDAEVHHGFYDGYMNLQSGVLTALSAIGSSNVRVTGHSLGGALSTLCAFDLQNYQGYKVTEAFSIGSPRVGDSTFAKYAVATLPILRVTHHHDIVPHVPEELLGFQHVATEIFYSSKTWTDGGWVTCDGSGEDSHCSNSCSPLSCTSIDDHLDYYNLDL